MELWAGGGRLENASSLFRDSKLTSSRWRNGVKSQSAGGRFKAGGPLDPGTRTQDALGRDFKLKGVPCLGAQSTGGRFEAGQTGRSSAKPRGLILARQPIKMAAGQAGSLCAGF